jgi:hypothetical protein
MKYVRGEKSAPKIPPKSSTKQFHFTCEYKGRKYVDSSELSISTYRKDFGRIRTADEIAESCIKHACKNLGCSKSELENVQLKLYEITQ